MSVGLSIVAQDAPKYDGKPDCVQRKRGDLVSVYPGAQCTEDPAPSSNLLLIVITDTDDEAALRKVLGAHESPQQERLTGPGRVMRSQSTYNVDVSQLPAQVQADLAKTGRASCKLAELEAATWHKDVPLNLKTNAVTKPIIMKVSSADVICPNCGSLITIEQGNSPGGQFARFVCLVCGIEQTFYGDDTDLTEKVKQFETWALEFKNG